MHRENIKNCKKLQKNAKKCKKIAKMQKCKKIAKMQKIAQKIAIFLKIAKNCGRDFPEGQVRRHSTLFTFLYMMVINWARIAAD